VVTWHCRGGLDVRLTSIVVGLLSGAAVGFVVGLLIAEDPMGWVFLAVVGAMFGGIAGGKLIKTVGWFVLAGAMLGGVIAILFNGPGKAAMYGAPLGAIMGLAMGLAAEVNRPRQCVDPKSHDVGAGNEEN
jgi:hypothetical protein